MGMAEKDRGAGARAPGRRRLHAAERRETILRAAAEVFAQVGYRAAKVSDVAARVGVTEPVIFQNFGSKAALFAAVVERAGAEVRTSLDEMAAGSGPGSGLLAHVLAGSAHGPGHDQASGHAPADPGARPAGAAHAGVAYGVLFADAAALADDPELGEPARAALRAVAGHLADLIRHAQSVGSVSPDADPEAAAWLLLSVLAARRLRAAAMPDGTEPGVTALALRALAPPGGSLTAQFHPPDTAPPLA
jgi:AcrR family transcriptional regulator